MNKATKTVGALALSAALALGTAVPAFAVTQDADGDGGRYMEQGKDGADAFTGGDVTVENGELVTGANTGSTRVRMLSHIGQLSATVPVQVYVVANVAGGELLASPTGSGAAEAKLDDDTQTASFSGYRIENNSNIPIFVTSVTATDGTTEKGDSGKWEYENGDFSDYHNMGDKERGRVHLTLTSYATADSFKDNLGSWTALKAAFGTPEALKSASTAAAEATDIAGTCATPMNWEIEKATYSKKEGKTSEFTPGVLGLKIGGKTSQIKDGATIQYGATDFPNAEYQKPAAGEVPATDIGDVQLVYTISSEAKTVGGGA